MSEDVDEDALSPAEVVEMYLDHRRPELSQKSLWNQKYQLDNFAEFCQERGIDDLQELTGRDIHRYRTWRSQQGISPLTLRTNLATLRVFLEFAASIDAAEEGLREKVILPEIDREDEAKDVKLDDELANTVLDYLGRFRYASRDHVIIGILWHTGIRLGTLRAFDVEDFDREDHCLRVRHRPETGTPLKNGKAAERAIAVGEYYCQVLEDYLENHRDPVTDEHGREPLISSSHGRLTETPIRDAVYRWTRPCFVGLECPHDRDPDDCEATLSKKASECPSSRSPHGVRRGALTRMLREGTPEQVVSDRSDVTTDVLEQHYDRRSERERMELRRKFLRDQ